MITARRLAVLARTPDLRRDHRPHRHVQPRQAVVGLGVKARVGHHRLHRRKRINPLLRIMLQMIPPPHQPTQIPLPLRRLPPEESRDAASCVKFYAEAMLSGKPFDAVIMDLTIPGGVGGKEAIKQLMEIDPSVKAIVSSGYATDPVMSRHRENDGRSVRAAFPFWR